MGKKIDSTLAILNGVVGDHLVRQANGLATDMTLAADGQPLATESRALARAYPQATPRVVVLVHGVMTTESIWRAADGSDYGARLAVELGVTPLYVRYNSGRAIADNGAELSRLLDALVAAYPVAIEELMLIGYSMGGLVLRSACHAGAASGAAWLPLVRRAIYIGTPHRGAPLERAGRLMAKLLQSIDDPYTKLIADIANLRSDGVKDLGDAHLRQQDRAASCSGLWLRDPRHPVPLLASMRHYLIAGSLWREPWLATLFGDAVVPVSSATDGACVGPSGLAFPPAHVRMVPGLGHVELARAPEVYAAIRAFCEDNS